MDSLWHAGRKLCVSTQAHRCLELCRQARQSLYEYADRQQHEEGHDGDDLEQVHVVKGTLQGGGERKRRKAHGLELLKNCCSWLFMVV